MRRSILIGVVLVTGLLVLLDMVIVNPSLHGAAGAVNELLVLLAAAAAVGGGATLVAHHVTNLAAADGDSVASIVLLLGMAVILVAGLRPGSNGSSDPAVLWLVAALLAPIAASGLRPPLHLPARRLPARVRAPGPRDVADGRCRCGRHRPASSLLAARPATGWPRVPAGFATCRWVASSAGC